ncbi:hypothetical protein V6Z11_1Z063500 [Gossypium hirsutum]
MIFQQPNLEPHNRSELKPEPPMTRRHNHGYNDNRFARLNAQIYYRSSIVFENETLCLDHQTEDGHNGQMPPSVAMEQIQQNWHESTPPLESHASANYHIREAHQRDGETITVLTRTMLT